MPEFRMETVADSATGLYSLEVYYPPDAVTPFVRTQPKFPSQKEALQFAVRKLQEVFPDKTVTSNPQR